MRDILSILGIGFLAETLYRSLMYSGWKVGTAEGAGASMFILCVLGFLWWRGVVEDFS